jgi:hypothetical protein
MIFISSQLRAVEYQPHQSITAVFYMLQHLQRLQTLRGFEPPDKARSVFFNDVVRVKRWQHIRLAKTYADLLADRRYQPATTFFLDQLYGGDETSLPSIRDRDLIRMYPTMKRILPKFAFETVTKALALDVLSEEFDQALALELSGKKITTFSYTNAFRAVGRQKERLNQVALMQDVGKGLDVVVKKPLIYSTLKLLRRPSKLAGLAEMQRFLEAGFSAFRHMKGADYFLSTITERETALVAAIFAGEGIDYQHEVEA